MWYVLRALLLLCLSILPSDAGANAAYAMFSPEAIGDALSEWGDNPEGYNRLTKRGLDKMYMGIRQRAPAPGMYFGIRNRRGGGYIRFGRSAPESFTNFLKASFGTPDKRSPGGQYMRFGRDTAHAAHANADTDAHTDAKRFMRFGKRNNDNNNGDDMVANEADKRFMRFGKKDGSDAEVDAMPDKRFMRFGKRADDSELSEEQKRFMRFGRMSEEEKRGFMRFGRDPLQNKRFMRFGRNNNEDAKRFMRFGKSLAEMDGEDELTPEKKDPFMRFGRDRQDDKRFMRFGRDPEKEKKFMRFGKREPNGVDEALDEEQKRFMRFGKRDDGEKDKKDYMRFGKKDGSDNKEH